MREQLSTDRQTVSLGRKVVPEHQIGAEFAGLWGGATLEPRPHRGIYRALVARRAKLAAARGATYLQVDASDSSRPICVASGPCSFTYALLKRLVA